MAFLAGIGWDMVGAASAATFYVPLGKVKKWSWETTWAVAGFFSWILLPITVSMALLPNFLAFYASIDSGVLWKAMLFGCVWGIGNINYGLAMRYLGMSLGIGVAIGVTLVVGTLVPPIVHGQAALLFTTRGGLFTLAGILVAVAGVSIVAYAGHLKEKVIRAEASQFNFKLGIIVATLCGIFSAGMSFAIDAAKPMAASAIHLGVNPLYAALPSYVIIMGGGALVNFTYCILRLIFMKGISLKDDLSQAPGALLKNGTMAATGGIMWYLQFFFYAFGAAYIPANLAYVNWMLLMSGYVLCGGLVGLVLSEWAGVGNKPVRVLWTGMIVIIAAACLVGLGMKS
jgi:L-rhamnose-H+ transport protein